nr:MAG TPA: hypothetical protein [Caudoviricetes sp.]
MPGTTQLKFHQFMVTYVYSFFPRLSKFLKVLDTLASI